MYQNLFVLFHLQIYQYLKHINNMTLIFSFEKER